MKTGMIFSSDRVREFLLKEGAVITFRKDRKSAGIKWIKKDRLGKKICDVVVKEIGNFKVDELESYVDGSSFSSLDEWKKEIKKMNDGKIPESGWLYLVLKFNPRTKVRENKWEK